MNKDQGFSSLVKIIIIAVLLILVATVVIIYSSNLDQDLVSKDQNKVNELSSKIGVDYDQLVQDYQSELKAVINAFNGNYQYLQDQITAIAVPSGFQDLHLQLILALNSAVYEENYNLVKTKLIAIATQYDWLVSSLDKVINSIK